MAAATVQAAGEFAAALYLHYGPGPHPDGSPQAVHAGGAPADALQGPRRPKPGKDQIAFDFTAPPAPILPALPPPLQAAESARQRLLAVASQYDADLARIERERQEATATYTRIGDALVAETYTRLRDDRAADPHAPANDARRAIRDAAQVAFARTYEDERALRVQRDRAAWREIAPAQPGTLGRAAGPADAAWFRIPSSQRQKIAIGLESFNLLVTDPPRNPGPRELRIRPAFVAGPESRASYDPHLQAVILGPSSGAHTVIHELGHHLEVNSPSLRAVAQSFLARRTAGEPAQELSTLLRDAGYAKEYAKPDQFIHPYVGRQYASGDTEVVAVGLEQMARDPVEFARRDPDHWRLIHTVMHGTWTKMFTGDG